MEEETGTEEGTGGQASEGERARRWDEAMGEWLEERRVKYRKGSYKQARLAWRRLVEQTLKQPWELGREDLEGHLRWMEEQGYAASTRANAVGYWQDFYRWCGERGADPEYGRDFNPAEGVKRPRVRRYEGAAMLSRGEVERLLRLMKRDETPLGKRDYAFVLLRLRTGAPLKRLKELRWGEVGGEEERFFAGCSLEKTPREHPAQNDTGGGQNDIKASGTAEQGRAMQLPEEVREAIVEWLRASGRLEGMKEGSYVFTPLRYPGREGTLEEPSRVNSNAQAGQNGSRREDWIEEKPLSNDQLLRNLKLYGIKAGIPEEKLTLMALRRTAVRMMLDGEGWKTEGGGDEGEVGFLKHEDHEDHEERKKEEADRVSRVDKVEKGDGEDKEEKEGGVEELQEFMESREEKKFTKYRMKFLPKMPEEEEDGEDGEGESNFQLPARKARPFKPGDGMTHGLYMKCPPTEEVHAVVEEGETGIEGEIEGMRRLGEALFECQLKAERGREEAQLANAYILMSSRLAGLIESKAGQASKEDRELEDRLVELQLKHAQEKGEEMSVEEAKKEIRRFTEARGGARKAEKGGRVEDDRAKGERRLREEIARVRWSLRRVLQMGLKAKERGETAELMHLCEVYSLGCNRLVRMLRADNAGRGSLVEKFREALAEVIEEVLEMKRMGSGLADAGSGWDQRKRNG